MSSRPANSEPAVSPRHLQVAPPDPEEEAWDRLVAAVIAQAVAEGDYGFAWEQRINWEMLSDFDGALLALGIPVAVSGDELIPDRPDPDADVHEAAVLNAERALVRHRVRQLPALESKALRLVWGIGCERHSQAQAAKRMGMTREGIRSTLRRGLDHLRENYRGDESAAA